MGNACLSMYVYICVYCGNFRLYFVSLNSDDLCMYVGMGCNLPAGDRRFGRRCSSQVRGQYFERSKRYIELYTYIHAYILYTLHTYIFIRQSKMVKYTYFLLHPKTLPRLCVHCVCICMYVCILFFSV